VTHGHLLVLVTFLVQIKVIHFGSAGNNIVVLNQNLVDASPLGVSVISVTNFDNSVNCRAVAIHVDSRCRQGQNVGRSCVPFTNGSVKKGRPAVFAGIPEFYLQASLGIARCIPSAGLINSKSLKGIRINRKDFVEPAIDIIAQAAQVPSKVEDDDGNSSRYNKAGNEIEEEVPQRTVTTAHDAKNDGFGNTSPE
jgi:hypothetical protein